MLRHYVRGFRVLDELSPRAPREIAAMYQTLLLEISGNVATITLNRPEKRNAISTPMIAAVNGAAYAGGCGIATLCDFTLAVPEAKFGYTEVKIGFLPAIVSVFLTRQIGEKRSRDLLLTGRIIEATEAKEFGLVSEIVPTERLMERAHELAKQLIAASPSSLTRSKHLLVSSAAAGVDHDLERAILENARIRCTPDFQEGLASFLEKRKPVWQDDSEK